MSSRVNSEFWAGVMADIRERRNSGRTGQSFYDEMNEGFD